MKWFYVNVHWLDDSMEDAILGANEECALESAYKNWPDAFQIQLNRREGRGNMNYRDYVKATFVKNQMNYGQDEQAALDAFSSQDFKVIENWLLKSGFDLENDFKYLSGK